MELYVRGKNVASGKFETSGRKIHVFSILRVVLMHKFKLSLCVHVLGFVSPGYVQIWDKRDLHTQLMQEHVPNPYY